MSVGGDNMNKYLKIFIGNYADQRSLDLFPDAPDFSQVLAVTSATSFEISGAYTKRSIRIPATQNNIAAFQLAGGANGALVDCAVEVDGIPLVNKGKAYIQESVNGHDFYTRQPKELSLVILSNNGDWIADIKDRPLSSLFTNADALTFDETTVKDGWKADYNLGDALGFCLIKQRAWAIAGEVQWYEFTPFAFLRTMLDRIFASIGYRLQSGFFDTAQFKDLIMPLLIPERIGGDLSEEYLSVRRRNNVTQIFTGPPTKLLFPTAEYTAPSTPIGFGWDVANDEYIVPFDGFYEVVYTADITLIPTPTPPATSYIFVDSFINNVSHAVQYGSAVMRLTMPFNTPTRVQFSRVFECVAGDVLNVFTGPPSGLGIAQVQFNNQSISIRGEIKNAPNMPIDPRFLLRPEWTCGDLIKGLTELFNLVWETDNITKTITVEPSDRYQNIAGGTVLDGFYLSNVQSMNDKMDFLQDGRTEYLQLARTKRFTYQTDDATTARLDQDAQLPLHSAQFTHSNTQFPNEIEEAENSFFAKTLMVYDDEISVMTTTGTGTPTMCLLPLIWPSDFLDNPSDTSYPNATRPRILSWGRQRGGTDGKVNYQGTVEDLPFAWFHNYAKPSDFSLSFADIGSSTGLLRRYHLYQLARIQRGVKIEDYMLLDIIDVQSLTFRNKLFIYNNLFILDMVDGYLPTTQQSTKVVLIPDTVPTASDAAQITSSAISGLVSNSDI